MKLDREAFLAALEQVKPALASAGSIPELKHVWLDGKYLYAYNGALGIRLAFTSELKPCGLPGSVLMGLLQSSSVKEATVTQTASTQIEIKLGRATATIPVFQKEQNPWPFPAKPPTKAETLILTEALLEGLKRVRIIKARNPTAVEHYGVVLFSGEVLALYTTTGKSLAEITVEGITLPSNLDKTVLPHGFVTQLLTLKPDSKLTFMEDALIAEGGGVQICSNLLDNAGGHNLPKTVDELITGKEKPVALPATFGEGLARALVLAGSTLDEAQVTLTVTKKELELSGKLEHGLLEERFPLTGATEGKIVVDLDHLKLLSAEATDFALNKRVMALYGKGDALFLLAGKD